MNNVLALILAGGRVDELSVLTLSRPKSAVPFGGMYRFIDFSLSNLMHSGVDRVGILSQYRSYSLLNHIGVGASWDFLGRDRGATMLIPSIGHKIGDWYRGPADAVYQNLEFVQEQNPETVMVLSGDHVYHMDYQKILAYHLAQDADLTIAFSQIDPKECSRFGVGKIADATGEPGGALVDYQEKPKQGNFRWASLTIYFFKTKVLEEVLAENAQSGQSFQFGKDIIPTMLGRYNVHGYKFDGYWGYTRTVDEYWATNMDLLGDEPRVNLDEWQLRTNLDHDLLRDRPPAYIGPRSKIENSLIHNGCVVHGEVTNSILFPGVEVKAGARVNDSILFYDCVVEHDASLEKTIADFEVYVGKGSEIGHGANLIRNRDYPELLKCGISLLGKGARLPSNVQLGKNCIVAPGLSEDAFKQLKYGSGLTIL